MLSALIPPVGRKPAVPLAGQLTHESYVRPGPLVLGTAFLRSPTAASDRDRQSVTASDRSLATRTFLPGSACRHADRTISSRNRERFRAWRVVSEDSGLCVAMNPAVPPAAVHPPGPSGKPLKPFGIQVIAFLHATRNAGEGDELLLLATQ